MIKDLKMNENNELIIGPDELIIGPDEMVITPDELVIGPADLVIGPDGKANILENDDSKNDQFRKSSSVDLLHWKDMPKHLQYNPYVITGYRPLTNVRGCVSSLFYYHNESINIITHGLYSYIFHNYLKMYSYFLTLLYNLTLYLFL